MKKDERQDFMFRAASGEAIRKAEEAEQFARALFDVLDGQYHWWEIHEQTGLAPSRCEEISNLFEKAAAMLGYKTFPIKTKPPET